MCQKTLMILYTPPANMLTYFLTPWCRVLLEKLTGLQLVKKFPALHGTRRFITALTSVRQLSLSRASPIQSIYPHPTSWRSSLIFSIHLRLGLPSGLLPSGFPTKTLYTPSSHPYASHAHYYYYYYYYYYYISIFKVLYSLRYPWSVDYSDRQWPTIKITVQFLIQSCYCKFIRNAESNFTDETKDKRSYG